MEGLEFCFIDKNSVYYDKIVDLRYRVFYEPSGVGMEGVFDGKEEESFHLAAICENEVVGYLRLTIEGEKGQVSQLVVNEKMRGHLVIAKGLIDGIVEKAKENSVHELYGEIRLHVANAAKAYGFEVSDEIIASKKTGLPHRRIRKII